MTSVLSAFLFISCRIDATDPRAPAKGQTQAGACTPANGATGVKPPGVALSWDFPDAAGKSGVAYDVYFGKANPPRTVLVRNYRQTGYSVAGLDPGATYYWEVNYLDSNTLVTGPIWSFTTTSQVNRKPVFTALADTAVNAGASLHLSLSAADPDGDSVTFSMQGFQGATLSGGSFDWTPGLDQAGKHQIRFIARDNGTPPLSDTLDIEVTVSRVGRAPSLQQPADVSVDEGSILRVTLSASDPDGDALDYSMRNAPRGAALSGNVFTWTPDTNQAGTYLVDFTVTERTADSLKDAKTLRVTVRDVSGTIDPGNGLVAYWDFNEGSGTTLTDKSGNGNNGTIKGATWGSGVEGGALSFNGIDQEVDLPASLSTSPNLRNKNATFSICFWAKPSLPALVGLIYGVNSSYHEAYLAYDVTGKFQFRTYEGLGKGQSVDQVTQSPPAGWYQVCYTQEGGGSQGKLYINGSLNNSFTRTLDVVTPSGLKIGGITTDNNFHFKGLLDEGRVYNRVLSASEIMADWNKHKDKASPSDGLAAYWPFSGNANDASGNGNNGTVSGAVLTADRFGNANSAYSFNGTNSDIRVAHSPSLNITGNLTISAWIWFDSAADSGGCKLIHKATAGEPNGYAIVDYATGYSSTGIYTPSFVVGNGVVHPLEVPSVFPKQTWVHFAGTYDGAKMIVYVNGQSVREAGVTGAIASNTQDLYIGNINRTLANQPFKGRLDDIRIYNRALTAAEVQALANEGK
jgi:hypothetical protein